MSAGQETLPATTGGMRRVCSEMEWQSWARQHEAAVRPWIDAYRDRRARRESHPVHDFLFAYYQVNRQTLKRWRPAARMTLQGSSAREFLDDERYVEDSEGVRLDLAKLDDGSRRRAQWVDRLIRAAKERPARFNCFGLHEWAMVYKAAEVRHQRTPLRLSAREVERVVESSVIRCSHYDAFRFFTEAARPRNELQPQRDGRESMEQFGCVHFNMDLYRWSCKLCPWIGSDLIRDCFLLAARARELDMRASPYDLSDYGYQAIPIEEPAGRERYRIEQEAIYRAAQPLAERLLDEIATLLGADCSA